MLSRFSFPFAACLAGRHPRPQGNYTQVREFCKRKITESGEIAAQVARAVPPRSAVVPSDSPAPLAGS